MDIPAFVSVPLSVKGYKDGECNRRNCSVSPATHRHAWTGRYYCGACRLKINFAAKRDLFEVPAANLS